VIAVWTAEPKRAEACSCAPPATRIHPADGATDVPPDTRLLVVRHSEPAVELRLAGTADTIALDVERWS
jgi:hypothetical protein